MLDRFRTAVRFFVYGVIVGVLCAPASGKETRSRLMGWLAMTVEDLVPGATPRRER